MSSHKRCKLNDLESFPAAIDPLPEAGADDGEGYDYQRRDNRIPDLV